MDLAELDRHPEARLPVLVFHAMGSGGPHIYCHTLTDAALRLVGGLHLLSEQAGLERLTGDP